MEILKTLNSGNSAFDRKQNSSGGGGGSSNPASKAQELLTKNTKKSYTGLGILANIAGKVLGGAFNLLASSVMASVGSFINLGKELVVGGNRLTDFAQHLPIPFLSTFTQLLDNQIDQYRELSQAGAGFGNSIIEISRVAAQAAMPQAEFLSMVRENSEELKQGTPLKIPGGSFVNWRRGFRYFIPPFVSLAKYRNILENAGQKNQIAHFWLHPHNLITSNSTRKLFEKLCAEVAKYRDKYNLVVKRQVDYLT